MPIATKRAPVKTAKRVTRSIAFEPALFDYLVEESKRQERSINWLVNHLVRKDLQSAE